MIGLSGSKTLPIVASVIGLLQAAILLVNSFGWLDITGAQAAAVTAVVTAAGGLWGSRSVNDQVAVALATEPPSI